MKLKEKNICLLFGIFPDENYQEIFACSRCGMQNAADALQKSIIKGLASHTSNISILNFPFIGSYPRNYAKPFSPSNSFSYCGVGGKNIRFFNGSIIKHYDVYLKTLKNLKNYLKEHTDEEVTVIVYSMNPSMLYACAKLKKQYKFNLIAIVPDLYEYTSLGNNYIRNVFKNFLHHFLKLSLDKIDAYVLLTAQMAEALPIGNRPCTIVEGIYTPSEISETPSADHNNNLKSILYTGSLSSKYGLPNLIKAFSALPNPVYRLIICGGNADVTMQKIIDNNTDNRIEFRGLLPRQEVLTLQASVDLLVNPRTSEGEFTKYSFPSKTMEYLASGTPVLLYPLPGIPDEYYEYCYQPVDESISSLSAKIDEILSKIPLSESRDKATKAKAFILNKKSPLIQTSKVIELIQNVSFHR